MGSTPTPFEDMTDEELMEEVREAVRETPVSDEELDEMRQDALAVFRAHLADEAAD